MKIGFLGGTFDPVHLGHLAIAEAARSRLSLNKVLFVPAGQPWLKTNRKISPGRDRIAMVKLAIKDYPYFEVSTIEIDHPGPSYTSDTLAGLKNKLGENTDLFLILGWDSLIEMPKWHDPAGVIGKCSLVAITRINGKPDLDDLEKSIPGIKKRTILLDMEPVDISSTEVRERVVKGLSLSGFVPEPVERYIEENNLYR